ncbi:unnamed protein product [Phytophthora lilii]|uniref:Unnamed protein product n=1 Tax=Phytophthora lilii TaxID=2077276 RepID=A0A9W6X5A5_9STRA|nr:unnamed protein product [Phytophthora lilii]
MAPALTVMKLYGSNPNATDAANNLSGTCSHGLAMLRNQFGVKGNTRRNNSKNGNCPRALASSIFCLRAWSLPGSRRSLKLSTMSSEARFLDSRKQQEAPHAVRVHTNGNASDSGRIAPANTFSNADPGMANV